VPVLTKLGKYEIRRELGRGAMGVVYEGFDPFIERAVAIKTIQKSLIDPSEAPEVFARFRHEAQAAGRLAHPNIVSIYEYGEEGDVAYIAMEFLAGVELKDYFDKAKQFHINEIVNITSQLLEALEYSHGRGVVHRDIKPSNILITRDWKIKIADFGIAKIESSDLTHVGTVLGTPSYMSPEQFMGLAADRRSDIYSVGVILYQMLTGERPFTGNNMNIIMHKVMHQAHVPPSELNPEVSKTIDTVVNKALSKRPEDRFQTAADFMAALKLAAEATIKLTPKKSPQDQNSKGPVISFNLDELNKSLDKNVQPKTSHIAIKPEEPEEDEPTVKATAPAPVTPKPESPPAFAESGLLARLAREAKEKQDNQQSAEQEKQIRERSVHDTLDRIRKFFTPFVQHVNSMEPTIGRTYRLDARSEFANLKWQGAKVDYRKQSLAESALLANVEFGVRLCSPEPVLIKRPLSQFDALKKELHSLRLNVLDDMDELYKKPKHEWLEVRLDPVLPVLIKFQGNYENGTIDVSTRNLEDFGTANCKLEPKDVTPAMLDELGLFLMGGTNQLPALLRRT
jgi:serine/threonine protein kinase